VGAGLLLTLADLGGDGVGSGVVGESGRMTAGGLGGFAETVERTRLAVSISSLDEDAQGLLVVPGGVAGLAEAGTEKAEAVQHARFTGVVAELPEQDQGLLEMVAGRPVPAGAHFEGAEAVQRVRLADPVAGLPVKPKACTK
jgi:hypothetical protein